jgi:Zn-dependent protease with chaperone function
MPADPIEAARALLPWWVPWANVLLLVPLTALVTAAATWTTSFIASRPLAKAKKAGPVSWYEEIRLRWPLARAANRLALLELVLLPALAFLVGNELSRVRGWWLAVLLFAVVFRTIYVVARPFRRRERKKRIRFPQLMKALLFLLLAYARLPVLVAMGFTIGPEFDRGDQIAAAVGLAVLVLLSTSLWVAIARATRLLLPPPPRLQAAVRTMAGRVGIAVPETYEADLPIANAFAMPRRHLLVVTRPAIELFDDAELAAIVGHEMGHLTESRAASLVRSLGIVALLPLVFTQPIGAWLGEPDGFWKALLLGTGVLLVAGFSMRLLLRRLEERADQVAHAHAGEPAAYVRALEKLHRENRMPLTLVRDPTRKRGLLSRLFARDVHGSFAERVAAIGGTLPPDLKPPSRRRAFAAGLVGTAIVVVAFLLTAVGATIVPLHVSDERRPLELVVALDPEPAFVLDALADQRAAQRNDDAVLPLKRAAFALRDDEFTRLSLASSLAEAGEVDEAADLIRPLEAELEQPGETARDRWLSKRLKEIHDRIAGRRESRPSRPVEPVR